MICVWCLQVKKKHPNHTARELSPAGSFEATTVVNGTALCNAHAELTLEQQELERGE